LTSASTSKSPESYRGRHAATPVVSGTSEARDSGHAATFLRQQELLATRELSAVVEAQAPTDQLGVDLLLKDLVDLDPELLVGAALD